MVSPGSTRSRSPTLTASAGDGQLFEKTAELPDERDLTRGEVFADADRRDQRERDEHVCLDVERRDKADDGL